MSDKHPFAVLPLRLADKASMGSLTFDSSGKPVFKVWDFSSSTSVCDSPPFLENLVKKHKGRATPKDEFLKFGSKVDLESVQIMQWIEMMIGEWDGGRWACDERSDRIW